MMNDRERFMASPTNTAESTSDRIPNGVIDRRNLFGGLTTKRSARNFQTKNKIALMKEKKKHESARPFKSEPAYDDEIHERSHSMDVSCIRVPGEDDELLNLQQESPYYDNSSRRVQKEQPIVLTTYEYLHEMIFGNPMNILLLVGPFGVASHYLNWSPIAVFICNFLTMIPLAALLGDFTEEAAAHTNETIGGLINASFGNAVEVVVAIQALLAGEYRIVQASMIGSIFSNLLLVLGCCFFFGGLKYPEQKFSQITATANMGLLGLSCIALILPTPFANYYEINNDDVLMISRIAAVCLIFMYAQLLLFQLKTHAHLITGEEEEEVRMPLFVAISGLVVITIIIAVLSEFLVGSIDGFCDQSGISRTFTGLIILPIVGNAVEHITAVSVAMKDKMDLAMGGKCNMR
jgi:Ca2+:H+ antiporter